MISIREFKHCSPSAFSLAIGCVSISCIAKDTRSHVVVCKTPSMRCSCNTKIILLYTHDSSRSISMKNAVRQLCWKSFNVTPLLLCLAGSQLKWASKAHSVSLWSSPSAQRIVCTLLPWYFPARLPQFSLRPSWLTLKSKSQNSFVFFPAKIPCEFALAWCNYLSWWVHKRTQGEKISGSMCVLVLVVFSPWGQNINTGSRKHG